MTTPTSAALSVPTGTVVVAENLETPLSQLLLDGRHRLLADEPGNAGGNDLGPAPYELLLMALGACTSITLRLYAKRHGWPLERATVTLKHSRAHAADCIKCEDPKSRLDQITCEIALDGPLTPEQKTRLLKIAESCPVHRTLMSSVGIETTLGTSTDDKRGELDALLDEALEESFPASDPPAVTPRK
jgi:putative redox protein